MKKSVYLFKEVNHQVDSLIRKFSLYSGRSSAFFILVSNNIHLNI